LIFAIAAASSGHLVWRISRLDTARPDVKSVTFERDMDSFTPTETLQMWKDLRQLRIETRPTPLFVMARQEAARLKRFVSAAIAIGCVGLVLAASAFFVKPGHHA
jgi:hypothetical protein